MDWSIEDVKVNSVLLLKMLNSSDYLFTLYDIKEELEKTIEEHINSINDARVNAEDTARLKEDVVKMKENLGKVNDKINEATINYNRKHYGVAIDTAGLVGLYDEYLSSN